MSTLSLRRILKLAPALVLIALVLPSAAFGQATRTWVSGTGDDANPCSRTAPCKTFAGAISKTAIGGIIDAQDDGGFGAVTITKSITIDGGHHTAGVLPGGAVNAININAGANDKINLRNLDIEGPGTTIGLNGVRITQAKSVKIAHVDIFQFSRNGIDFVPSNPGARLIVQDTRIHEIGGNGLMVAPANAASGLATLRNVQIDDALCGATASMYGSNSSVGTDCGTNTSASATSAFAAVASYRSSFADVTATALLSRGPNASQRASEDEIIGSTDGFKSLDGGVFLSWGNNFLTANTNDVAPGTTVGHIGLFRPLPRRR